MNKNLASLAALTIGSLMENPVIGENPKPKRRVLNPNERRKCFYKFCKNMRPNSMDLYCCEECKTKARQYQK
ncbi:MAG: hypothetical protein WC827_04065 [Candidatus Paceibacterota bacterium]|jgi:hypothetical protein